MHNIQRIQKCVSLPQFFLCETHKKEKGRKEIATAMSKLMKKKGLVKFLVVVLILVAVIVFFQIKGTSTSDNSDKYKDVDLTATNDSYGREDTYAKYVTQHERIYQAFYDVFKDFSNQSVNIVGKNNLGKSNIIKAINIVLGENSHTCSIFKVL